MKENTTGGRTYPTFEAALQDPAMARYHDAIRWLSTAKDDEAFPTKYLAAQKLDISMLLHSLLRESPETPLKTAVAYIVDGISKNITEATRLELTRWTVSEWERISAEHMELAPA